MVYTKSKLPIFLWRKDNWSDQSRFLLFSLVPFISHILWISDFSISRASGPARYGAHCRDFLVLALILFHDWICWFISTGCPASFQILPPFSTNHHSFHEIYRLFVFLVASCASFSPHVPWALVDVAQIAYIDALIFMMDGAHFFVGRGSQLMVDDCQFWWLNVDCNQHVLREHYMPFRKFRY